MQRGTGEGARAWGGRSTTFNSGRINFTKKNQLGEFVIVTKVLKLNRRWKTNADQSTRSQIERVLGTAGINFHSPAFIRLLVADATFEPDRGVL